VERHAHGIPEAEVKRRVVVISVVPSPYQRDLFAALAAREELDLSVFYLEAASPDSPWPEKPLASYEHILPGFWFSLRGARVHVNWGLPQVQDFDLVVLNTLMSLTAQRLMRGPLRHVPWIFLGEKLGSRRGGWHDRLTKPLHRAAGIAAIGTWAQRDYQERFPEPLSFNLPYCCELAAFLAKPHRTRDTEPVFLFCGQMIARKGVDLLLSAFARLPEGRLLLVGREAELSLLLKGLPEATCQRIEYAGFQPPDELPGLFARADVFVLPSRYDGWGVVVNQAIGAGLPVICSDQVGAGYDLVEEGVNGTKFRAGDEASLHDALRRYIDDPASIDAQGEESRAKAREWVPEIGATRWVSAIDEVLSK
jgi:glycosyltransferase involved in cell wall biosynthesis